jgi:hypothetical protein
MQKKRTFMTAPDTMLVDEDEEEEEEKPKP